MPRRIVDLTQPFPSKGIEGSFRADGYERPMAGHGVFHRITMETTAGTHVVTARRYLASGHSLSEASLGSFFGEGIVLRLPAADGITDIGAVQLDEAGGDQVRHGDIVVLGPSLEQPIRTKLTVFASQWLWTKGVKMLVLDHRIDIGSSTSWTEERTVLTSLFANDIPVVRGATNTEALSEQHFAIMAIPLNVEDVESWPVRVVALDPGDEPIQERARSDVSSIDSADVVNSIGEAPPPVESNSPPVEEATVPTNESPTTTVPATETAEIIAPTGSAVVATDSAISPENTDASPMTGPTPPTTKQPDTHDESTLDNDALRTSPNVPGETDESPEAPIASPPAIDTGPTASPNRGPKTPGAPTTGSESESSPQSGS